MAMVFSPALEKLMHLSCLFGHRFLLRLRVRQRHNNLAENLAHELLFRNFMGRPKGVFSAIVLFDKKLTEQEVARALLHTFLLPHKTGFVGTPIVGIEKYELGSWLQEQRAFQALS